MLIQKILLLLIGQVSAIYQQYQTDTTIAFYNGLFCVEAQVEHFDL